jgi:hypothetical protein
MQPGNATFSHRLLPLSLDSNFTAIAVQVAVIQPRMSPIQALRLYKPHTTSSDALTDVGVAVAQAPSPSVWFLIDGRVVTSNDLKPMHLHITGNSCIVIHALSTCKLLRVHLESKGDVLEVSGVVLLVN